MAALKLYIMKDILFDWLNKLGLVENSVWQQFIVRGIIILGLAVIIFIIYKFFRKWLSIIIFKLTKKTRTNWDDILFEEGFFNKLSYIIPPILIKICVSNVVWLDVKILHKIVSIWFVIAPILILFALFDTINKIYNTYQSSKNRPITVVIQMIKVFIIASAVISLFAILFNKDIVKLIYSLGAFAAVIMLIFKDSILGFVAGLQLASNKMISIGDWIEVPKHHADGEVLEITLYTVRVKNWDMTITTVPTYSLISDSFTNWTSMQKSGGRRIKRSVFIDIKSVRFLNEADIEKLRGSDYLKDYIDGLYPILKENNENKIAIIDQMKLTNIGVFRNYLQLWLKSNKELNHNMTSMVRQTQPTPNGIPLEVYCFSANKVWVEYERIQADIFDHIMAIIPEFDLQVFQYATELKIKQ